MSSARSGRSAVVRKIDSPYGADNGSQISRDGHSALVNFEFNSSPQDAMKISKPVEDAVIGVQKAHPDLRIAEFGDGSAEREVEGQFVSDLAKAGLLSLPLTLIILLITFGALVAAGIPLLLALTSVIAAMFLIAIPSHLLAMDAQVKEVILLIGLAVGVDYSLFYLKREREERAAGRSESAALEAAAATSGRSVLISGVTVMIAMAGMFFAGDPAFSSFAVATILVVAIAMLGSLTVLPAVLSGLGDRVEKGRVPFLHRAQRGDGDSRLWGWILDRVLARPALFAVLSAGLLVAIALPALSLRTSQIPPEALPQNLKAVQTYNRINKAFPTELHTATVVVKAENVNAPDVRASVAELRTRAATIAPKGTVETEVNSQGTAETITVPLAGNGSNALSRSGVTKLREEIVPATLGTLTDIEYGVAGGTAIDMDSRSAMNQSAPMVFAFVLIFAFVLLLISFRSLVIAAKAVILNLLSVAAAYGVLVLVFQHGWGKGLIGFDYTGGITSFLPIFLFVILFGLSMDYHVFIISRIREARDRGLSTPEAVSHGIKTTAGVVTSAALVMVLVFAVFATGSIIVLQQLGDRARRRRPDRRDDRQGRAAAGLDDAARGLELVPAQVARVAASIGARRRRREAEATHGADCTRAPDLERSREGDDMSELPGRTDVLVVGAGPAGLAVAASLTGHGHDVTVVDRQATGANTSRAAVVHARTLEMLERIGVSERLAGLGIQAQRFSIRRR